MLLWEVAAAATSVGRLAVDQHQEQECPLLEAASSFDEDVVAVSWNRAQRVHPSQTDHDWEEVNNGEGLQMMSLHELHYTARDKENAC